MSFPGIPGGRSIPGPGDMGGMSQQEQELTRAV